MENRAWPGAVPPGVRATRAARESVKMCVRPTASPIHLSHSNFPPTAERSTCGPTPRLVRS